MQITVKPNNPFINSLQVPYIEVIKKIEAGAITDSYKIEAADYTRLYKAASLRDYIFTNLSMYARDMYLSILYRVNTNYKYIVLSYEIMCELYANTKYGKRRYDDTIKELVIHSIIDIKDKSKNQYWYNPIYFSPNSRIILFEESAFKISTRNTQ